MNIHELIREKCELAAIYAEDGAFLSAARVFEDLGSDVKRHAISRRRETLQAQLDHARNVVERADYIDDFTRHRREKDNGLEQVRIVERLLAELHEQCPGHIRDVDGTCATCGARFEAAPEDDPINLAGSGPVPVEPREG